MLVTCVPPANKPVGPAFDFFSVLYFNLYARTGHISHVCLRLYIAPVAPVWWSLIALLIHFYTPQPCQIRHPPPQAYPWPLTSSRQLKVGWCALIWLPKLWFPPDLEAKLGQILSPLSRIWVARFCLHVAFWVLSKLPHQVCYTCSASDRHPQTRPPPAPHSVWPTITATSSQSQRILSVTLGQVDENESVLAGNYWALSIARASIHTFHTSCTLLCKPFAIL